MPSIDFQRLRREIALKDVLQLLGYRCFSIRGGCSRGPCPAACHSDNRCCSFDFSKQVWHCHRCGQGGGVLDLWMCVKGLEIYAAARGLCEALGRPVPCRR